MEIKKKIFGVPIALFVIGILLVGGVSAALVTYLSNTVSEEITVESPILLEETEFELDILYGGEDDFVLIKITNLADVDTTGDFEITINPDVVGISIAVTEDINYCFKTQGDMTGVTDCETGYLVWMANNIDWNDWYANAVYTDAEYPSLLVTNHGGDSFYALGYTGNKLILPDLTIPAGEIVYGVIYVATDSALAPATYNFNMTFVP